MLLKTLQIASGKKFVTAIGALIGGIGTIVGAVALDATARERYPLLPAIGVACTTLGGLLTTFGKGLADARPTDAQRTAEYQAQQP